MKPEDHFRKNILGKGHSTHKWEHACAQPTKETMAGIDERERRFKNIGDQRPPKVWKSYGKYQVRPLRSYSVLWLLL